MSIQTFVQTLTKQVVSNNSYNQYTNPIIKNNLKIYLSEMKKLNPKILCIGEAAGYNGCRLTGIAFTSEYLMMKENHCIFGASKGYKTIHSNTKLQKEISATIVWEVLNDNQSYPLLWNAVPFHPFKNRNYKSNRTPDSLELQIGKFYIQELLNEFSNICYIVAIGKKAEKSLIDMNLSIDIKEVRHPSNGGKNDFVSGLQNIITQI